MIHEKVIEALSPLGIPVQFHSYEPTNETSYITFFQYDESTSLSVDDEERYTDYFVQINLYSKDDYGELLHSLKECMKTIGARRRSEIEFQSGEWYQRTIRFVMTFSKEEI